MSEYPNEYEVIEKITTAAKDRFTLEVNGTGAEELIALASEDLVRGDVVRLQRTATGTKGFRTLLLATLQDPTQMDLAVQWAASCKQDLIDPGAADLYLVVVIQDNTWTIEQCLNIEADEKFCRKFILRPQETLDDLIQRTFLTRIMDRETEGALTDPLTIALRDTNSTHQWFSTERQQTWRAAFLSGKSGSDLIDILFEDVYNSNLQNEAP